MRFSVHTVQGRSFFVDDRLTSMCDCERVARSRYFICMRADSIIFHSSYVSLWYGGTSYDVRASSLYSVYSRCTSRVVRIHRGDITMKMKPCRGARVPGAGRVAHARVCARGVRFPARVPSFRRSPCLCVSLPCHGLLSALIRCSPSPRPFPSHGPSPEAQRPPPPARAPQRLCRRRA